jgi:outer membrane protein
LNTEVEGSLLDIITTDTPCFSFLLPLNGDKHHFYPCCTSWSCRCIAYKFDHHFNLYVMKNLKLLVLALLLLKTFSGFAQQKNELDIRVRAIGIIPQESATIGVIGGGANISNTYVPELDFTYFFANNFSAELILATTKHNVSTTSSNLSAIGGSSSADVNLGHVWLLPPTLTLQYHVPTGSVVKPYVGAGLNYTIFYSADKGPVVQDISYKNKFAFAAQLGTDIDVSKKVFINIDLKKIFLSTNASVNAANLTPATNPALASALSNINADVKIRPWVIGIGAGYRFK